MKRNSNAYRLATVAISVGLIAFAIVFYLTDGLGLLSIHPRASLSEYQWGELKQIALMIAAADSDEEGVEIAKEFNLCREDGTLDPKNTKTVVFTDGSGKQDFRIVGFRHDKVAGKDSVYGITFCFVGPVDAYPMVDAERSENNIGGWETSFLHDVVNAYIETPPSFNDKLPIELGRVIGPVEKAGSFLDGDVEYDTSSTADRIFLLSYSELVGASRSLSTNSSLPGDIKTDDKQYQYFREHYGRGGSGAFEQDAYPFWLRTGADTDYSSYLGIVSDGVEGRFAPGDVLNVVVGFCL